ncbi:Oidioi.mRNA.OKI2018_I69.PAR.g10719.t1.cds [Oikopleura dioica]|uniref:Oidioi.mRNA.OKI2018_I69.PAR.g10719.t1.cds n=1 Tax=Oikopleura dioica TaxID=34765 RepID=A0ABN7RZE1_OIKDI|nr:Oidioi.mRNA.OKI2018_I69.PAR.g10719.t1.cds [Oikopleura dioica]
MTANGSRSDPLHITTDYSKKPDFLPRDDLPMVQKVFGTANFTDGFAFQWLNPTIPDNTVDDIVYLVHILDQETMYRVSYALKNKILTKKSYFTVRGLIENHPYVLQIWTIGYKNGEFFKSVEEKTVFTRTLSSRNNFVTCEEYLCSHQNPVQVSCGNNTTTDSDICKKSTTCYKKYSADGGKTVAECPSDYNCRVQEPWRWPAESELPQQDKENHECYFASTNPEKETKCKRNSNCCYVDDDCFPRRLCPHLSIPNGSASCGSDKCEVSCDPGFYIVGNRFPTCINREWSHIPTCTPNKCEPIDELLQYDDKTKATCTKNPTNSQDSKCEISCVTPSDDTRIVGVSSIQCSVRPDTGKVAWVWTQTNEPVHSGTVGLCLPILDLENFVFEQKRKCECTDTSIDDEFFCDGKCDCPGCIDETYKSCLLRAEMGFAFPNENARTSVTLEILDLVHSTLEFEVSPTEAKDSVFLDNIDISNDLVCDNDASMLAYFNFCEEPQETAKNELFTKIKCVYKLPESFVGGDLTASYDKLLPGSAAVSVTTPDSLLKTHTLSGQNAVIEWASGNPTDPEVLYYEITITLTDRSDRKRRSAVDRREVIISATQTEYKFTVLEDQQYQFQAVAVREDGSRVIVVQTSGEHENKAIRPAPVVSVFSTSEKQATFSLQNPGYEYLGVRISNRFYNYEVQRANMTDVSGNPRLSLATIDLPYSDTSYKFDIEFLVKQDVSEKLKIYSMPAVINFKTKKVLEIVLEDVGSDYLVFSWNVDGIPTVSISPDISNGVIKGNSVEFSGLFSNQEYNFTMTLRDANDSIYYDLPADPIVGITHARVEDFDIVIEEIRSDRMKVSWPTVKDANGKLPISERFALWGYGTEPVWVCFASPCEITGLIHRFPYVGNLTLQFESSKEDLVVSEELGTAPRAPEILLSEIRSTEIQIKFDTLFNGTFNVTTLLPGDIPYTQEYKDPDVTLGGLPEDTEMPFASFIRFSSFNQTNTFPVTLTTNPKPRKLKVISGDTNSVKFELDQEVFEKSKFVNMVILPDYTSEEGKRIDSHIYHAKGLEAGKTYKAETSYRWENDIRMINAFQSIDFNMTTDEDVANFTTANYVGDLTFTEIHPNNMTISWDPVENAVSYDLKYFINSNPDRTTLPDQYFTMNLKSSEITLTNLIQDKQYGFQLFANFDQNFMSNGELTFERTTRDDILPPFYYSIECRSTWIRVEFTTDYDLNDLPPRSASLNITRDGAVIESIQIDPSFFDNTRLCDDSCKFLDGTPACSPFRAENSKTYKNRYCSIQTVTIENLIPSTDIILEIDIDYNPPPGKNPPQNGITRFLRMAPSAPVISLERAADTKVELTWTYDQEEWDAADDKRKCSLTSSTQNGTTQSHILANGTAHSTIKGMLAETPYEIELYCDFEYISDLDELLYKSTDSIKIKNTDGTGPTISGLVLEKTDSLRAYGKWNTPGFAHSKDEYNILVSDHDEKNTYKQGHKITINEDYTEFETTELIPNEFYRLNMDLVRLIREATTTSHRFEQWTNTQTIEQIKTPRRLYPEILELGSDYIIFGWENTFQKVGIFDSEPPLDSSPRTTDVRIIEAKTSSNPALISMDNIEAGNVTISIDLAPAPDTDSWFVNISPVGGVGGGGQSESGDGSSCNADTGEDCIANPTFGDLEPGETYQVTTGKNDGTVAEIREHREEIVNSNATIFNLQKSFIKSYLERTNSVDDEEVQVAYQVYETDSFKRFGPRKRLRDMIGNETIENVGSDVQERIDEWKYEGGLYNPGEALYFAGPTKRQPVKNVIIMTMSNTGGIASTINKETSLIRGLRSVQFCLKAEILVIGLHDETDERGDDQTFEEYMNLVGCWGHGDTKDDLDKMMNNTFEGFSCTDERCPFPDEETYEARIRDTKITKCENVFRMPKSEEGIPDLISQLKRRLVELARDDEAVATQDKYIFDEPHTLEERMNMCKLYNTKLFNLDLEVVSEQNARTEL